MMKLTILVFAVVIATAYALDCTHKCHDMVCHSGQIAFCNASNQCECKHQVKKRDDCHLDADCAGYSCGHHTTMTPFCNHSTQMCACM